MNIEELMIKARRFLENNERNYSYGYVKFWQGKVYGWSEMLIASYERPSVIALNIATGEVYRAVGGNDYNGAQAWELVNQE